LPKVAPWTFLAAKAALVWSAIMLRTFTPENDGGKARIGGIRFLHHEHPELFDVTDKDGVAKLEAVRDRFEAAQTDADKAAALELSGDATASQQPA
jgi:hypothetical protein